jgi:hypothetical protein
VDLDLGTIRGISLYITFMVLPTREVEAALLQNSTELEPIIRLFRAQLLMHRIALKEFVPCRHMRTKGETKVESRAVQENHLCQEYQHRLARSVLGRLPITKVASKIVSQDMKAPNRKGVSEAH